MFEDMGRVKHYADGKVVFAENEPGRSMYVIESGQVRLTRTNMREAGEIVTELAVIGPPAFFGEMALFDRKPRSATATAVGDVELREVSRKDVERELARNPRLALELLERMSRRIRRTDTLIERLLVREKLAEDVYAQISALQYPDSLAT